MHLDINMFFASVEINENPLLRDKVMAVAGDESRRGGVILTASYEARKWGIKAGMSNRDALHLYPSLLMVPPRMDLYKGYSEKVMNILRNYTYKVEQFSIDEAWLDITDIISIDNTAYDIAFEIKERVKYEIGITVSVGLSYCKVLAKLASDTASIDSIYKIDQDILRTIVWKMPIKELLGVGKKTKEKLHAMNIYTIGELANTDIALLKAVLKKSGEQLWKHANGFDKSEVNYIKSFPKSISNAHTARKDIYTLTEAKRMLLLLSEHVGMRLRKYKATATVISITVKTNDFNSYTRQKKLVGSTCTTNRIYDEAIQLLLNNWDAKKPIRLLGVAISDIQYYEEQISFSSLVNDKEFKDETIDCIIDSINMKYNKTIITRAGILETHKIYDVNYD